MMMTLTHVINPLPQYPTQKTFQAFFYYYAPTKLNSTQLDSTKQVNVIIVSLFIPRSHAMTI